MDIFHIGAGAFQKMPERILCNFFVFLFESAQNPSHQGPFILRLEFCHPAVFLDGLVEPVPLIYLCLCEQKAGGLREAWKIVGQLIALVFEEAAVFDQNQPALCKKGQRVCQADDLGRVDALSFKTGKVHCIVRIHQGVFQFVFILIAQIGLLSVEKVGGLEAAVFNVLSQHFHNSLPQRFETYGSIEKSALRRLCRFLGQSCRPAV